MDPNRLSERRKKDRRNINIPVSVDRRKGNRRDGTERRDGDWSLTNVKTINKLARFFIYFLIFGF